MKYHPILFSGPMVRAILEGRKTQTRRVVKPQPERSLVADSKNRAPLAFWMDNKEWIKPRYQPGDRLWVKETWCNYDDWLYIYKATPPNWAHNIGWSPSTHMPRDAARITLEVTNVRVERLQEISEKDAKAEGAPCIEMAGSPGVSTHTNGFATLWDSLAKPGTRWDNDPWVWVVEFKIVEPEERK